MVDILKILEAAVERNTQHYKSDFETDRKLILEAAAQPEPEYFLWLSRPCGTECFYERDAYIQESYAHHAWIYHAESRKSCIAYAIETLALRDGIPMGNVWPLDLRRHAAEVKSRALHAHMVNLLFDDGYKVCLEYSDYRQNIHHLIAQHGTITERNLLPEDEYALDFILRSVRAERQMK